MKVGLGRILGIVGGLITVIGAVLPWATISGGTLCATPCVFSGLTVGAGGIGAALFGVLGLILAAIGKKITAILGIVMGVLALLSGLLAFIGLAALAALAGGSGVTVTTNYGVGVALVGALILIVGSAIGYMEAKKAAAAPPMMPTAPMSPPPMG